VIIQHAVWLYLRFTLSYRDVKELLAERGLDISARRRSFLRIERSFINDLLVFSTTEPGIVVGRGCD
jgi:hypothetical protein